MGFQTGKRRENRNDGGTGKNRDGAKAPERCGHHDAPHEAGASAARDHGILGTVGYLCAIFLTILCGLMTDPALPFSVTTGSTRAGNISVTQILSVMTGIAVCRGILHYAEQYCNHFRNVFSLVLLAIYGRMSYKNYRKF